MWFSFFKAEEHAEKIYEMLAPKLIVLEQEDGSIIDLEELEKVPENSTGYISAVKLMQFIDLFNYYPINATKLRLKNDSNELTYVMTSNQRGTADFVKPAVRKPPEEVYLLKLLELVSNKLYERFKNLNKAFRYLDTDHSQQISLTEFAQAIDHLRVKISFDDVKKLFRYMDS